MKPVLVIEDNQDNLKLITYALQRAGYQRIRNKQKDQEFTRKRRHPDHCHTLLSRAR